MGLAHKWGIDNRCQRCEKPYNLDTAMGECQEPLTVVELGTALRALPDSLQVADGLNSNLRLASGQSFLRLHGPEEGFSIGGFFPLRPQGEADGRLLRIFNVSGQPMSIVNEDEHTVAAGRINTFAGDVQAEIAEFIYDAVSSRWLLLGAR